MVISIIKTGNKYWKQGGNIADVSGKWCDSVKTV
jgi:hypothetical protein